MTLQLCEIAEQLGLRCSTGGLGDVLVLVGGESERRRWEDQTGSVPTQHTRQSDSLPPTNVHALTRFAESSVGLAPHFCENRCTLDERQGQEIPLWK